MFSNAVLVAFIRGSLTAPIPALPHFDAGLRFANTATGEPGISFFSLTGRVFSATLLVETVAVLLSVPGDGFLAFTAVVSFL